MVEFKAVSKQFHVAANTQQVLQDINLSVATGEIFGVIGASGAGKSTLIRCLNGLEQPTSGEVWVDGNNITLQCARQLRESRRNIGMIFQHFNLLNARTVYDNIALPLEIIGLAKAEIKRHVQPLLELTSLTEKSHFFPSQLSGGQKQRVAIARALASNPKLLLCDEATSALDPPTTHSILQLLDTINRTLNLTILLITHEMEVVKEICHRLAIIDQGKIIECADVLSFFSDPQTEIARSFIRKALKRHLPEALQQRVLPVAEVNTNTLMQISFIGQAAQEPLISEISQRFEVSWSILQANIEQIRGQTVGSMVVEAETTEQLAKATTYLRSRGVQAEVIGYVKCNR